MRESALPERIAALTRGECFRESSVGRSGCRVWIGKETVLKIGPVSPEREREARMLTWLSGRLPVPEILALEERGGEQFCLMSRLRGQMLCEPSLLRDAPRLTALAAEALRLLWSVDLRDCPCEGGQERQLRRARERVEKGLVDVAETEPETFGPGGFEDPAALLRWLEDHRPPEEPVLTHGDLCLPNILTAEGRISGLIDCADMGPGDRWQDLALCLRSMRENLAGDYNGGQAYGPFAPETLLELLGVEPDAEKLRWYLLLDELF